jgi:putative ATPase
MQKPLAEQLRPDTLDGFIGQAHLFEQGSPLKTMIETKKPRSIVLQGPPGTGKTTLARLISQAIDAEFVELNAIDSGVREIREVSKRAVESWQMFRRETVLFLDEIHRFSKSQQDSLLKATENGTISLIGATTENPSFALNPAMLSRLLIVKLLPLTPKELSRIAKQAISHSGKDISDEALELLLQLSSGDARRLISIIEMCESSISVASIKRVQSAVQLHYDRAGDNHYQTISALIKSVRGSDVNAALHYLAVMLVGGEDPMFIARRLAILASEDIGLANANALSAASSTLNIVHQIGMPEARIPLAQLTIMLSLSGKSNSAYTAINQAMADVEAGLTADIPDSLLPRGKGYLYPHDYSSKIVHQKHSNHDLPTYYHPTEIDGEKIFGEIYSRVQEALKKDTGI